MGLPLDRQQVIEGYMVFGGIPFYWSLLERNKNFSQNIDSLFFGRNAKLKDEFQELYRSLFAIPADIDIMAQSWNLGIEAGYVTNTLDVSEYKATARSGFKLGLDAEYQFANKICLESGLAYIRKGATTSGTRLLGTEINSIKFAEMDYL